MNEIKTGQTREIKVTRDDGSVVTVIVTCRMIARPKN